MEIKGRFNLLNKKFGRLLVIEYSGTNVKQHRCWKCLCDCGKEIVITASSLVNQGTKSCGCLQKEVVGNQFRTHGEARGSEYKSWQKIKERCLVSTNPAYHNYGGRGITICDEWINSFETFLSDVGKKPTKSHTIDRINNDGNYCKENCKWSTRKEQSLNKRDTFMITFNNETKPLMTFCEELNLDYFVIRLRIKKLKWSIKDALTIPIRIIERNGIQLIRKINFNKI